MKERSIYPFNTISHTEGEAKSSGQLCRAFLFVASVALLIPLCSPLGSIRDQFLESNADKVSVEDVQSWYLLAAVVIRSIMAALGIVSFVIACWSIYCGTRYGFVLLVLSILLLIDFFASIAWFFVLYRAYGAFELSI
ncbi:hypothetical protein [Bremerella sp. P1]|uniref:hypothetical protein n=1 Tax=Bremerella sp. P1 TaxID=3026424 RepID=UPI002367D490|nr:hypothetical protein [Bremerella sp. P1]WDI42173.1 hypothetical protein PSR63_27355 [Bremerella sp. P1]